MPKVKTYPLEIHAMYELESWGPPMAYYSRGHHDPADFWAALWAFFFIERNALLDYTSLRAEHWLMRCVPFDGEQMWAQCPAKEGAGAFPVTYVDACWIDEHGKGRVVTLPSEPARSSAAARGGGDES